MIDDINEVNDLIDQYVFLEEYGLTLMLEDVIKPSFGSMAQKRGYDVVLVCSNPHVDEGLDGKYGVYGTSIDKIKPITSH